MKFTVKWFVDAKCPDTYMGEDEIEVGSFDDAIDYAYDNADGFDFWVMKGE